MDASRDEGTITEEYWFPSGDVYCAASLYRAQDRPGDAPCLVMAHGFTGTRDQLRRYAERFAAAGVTVLTFDYRHFGESGGEPRQVIRLDEQLEDWRAAIRFARAIEGVGASRVALWGTSLAGGHVINLAAEDSSVAAVVAQVPAVDKSTKGMAQEARAKMEREGVSLGWLVWVSLRSLAAGVVDAVRGLLRLAPHYMPVFGPPGSVAAFTDPECGQALEFFSATGPTWRNEFAPRFLFGTPRWSPGTASRIGVPLLVCVADHDTEANPVLAASIAREAPHGSLKIYPARHFDVYQGAVFEQMVSDQVHFLSEAFHLPQRALGAVGADAPTRQT